MKALDVVFFHKTIYYFCMKKRISIPVETEFHAAVKILAIRRGISLTALIQNLLKKELTQ